MAQSRTWGKTGKKNHHSDRTTEDVDQILYRRNICSSFEKVPRENIPEPRHFVYYLERETSHLDDCHT
jgi:hypothetical protein